jgi:hypothetical protein
LGDAGAPRALSYPRYRVAPGSRAEIVDELIAESVKTGHPAGPLAFHLAKKLEYGLKLVKDRAGTDEFVLNSEAVRNMEQYVDDLVKSYYRNGVDLQYPEEAERMSGEPHGGEREHS